MKFPFNCFNFNLNFKKSKKIKNSIYKNYKTNESPDNQNSRQLLPSGNFFSHIPITNSAEEWKNTFLRQKDIWIHIKQSDKKWNRNFISIPNHNHLITAITITNKLFLLKINFSDNKIVQSVQISKKDCLKYEITCNYNKSIYYIVFTTTGNSIDDYRQSIIALNYDFQMIFSKDVYRNISKIVYFDQLIFCLTNENHLPLLIFNEELDLVNQIGQRIDPSQPFYFPYNIVLLKVMENHLVYMDSNNEVSFVCFNQGNVTNRVRIYGQEFIISNNLLIYFDFETFPKELGKYRFTSEFNKQTDS